MKRFKVYLTTLPSRPGFYTVTIPISGHVVVVARNESQAVRLAVDYIKESKYPNWPKYWWGVTGIKALGDAGPRVVRPKVRTGRFRQTHHIQKIPDHRTERDPGM